MVDDRCDVCWGKLMNAMGMSRVGEVEWKEGI